MTVESEGAKCSFRLYPIEVPFCLLCWLLEVIVVVCDLFGGSSVEGVERPDAVDGRRDTPASATR